jgi:hypothetical protein
MILALIVPFTTASGASRPQRPHLIESAAPDDIVYYFGVGSNMLRSKIVNRGLNGSTIDLIDFQPAVVKAHRLGFTMRGIPPLEPGMGSLEPCETAAEDGQESECHGALCTMRADEYEKLWLSEGGGQPNPGYEEVVVRATPYGMTEEQAVPALALRTRPHARLSVDACPSPRYMALLIGGATELGLQEAYVDKLRATQVQLVPGWLRALGVHYLFLVTWLFRVRGHGPALVRALSSLLWRAYVPSTCSKAVRRWAGDLVTGLLLLPGATVGALIRLAMHLSGAPLPPMLAALMAPSPTAKPPEGATATAASTTTSSA